MFEDTCQFCYRTAEEMIDWRGGYYQLCKVCAKIAKEMKKEGKE